MQISSIVKSPVLTEKATELAKSKVYVFEVALGANKHQIREALKNLYEVEVAQVRVITRRGKVRRAGRRMHTKKLPDKKIAYVKLTKGKIDIFPQK